MCCGHTSNLCIRIWTRKILLFHFYIFLIWRGLHNIKMSNPPLFDFVLATAVGKLSFPGCLLCLNSWDFHQAFQDSFHLWLNSSLIIFFSCCRWCKVTGYWAWWYPVVAPAICCISLSVRSFISVFRWTISVPCFWVFLYLDGCFTVSTLAGWVAWYGFQPMGFFHLFFPLDSNAGTNFFACFFCPNWGSPLLCIQQICILCTVLEGFHMRLSGRNLYLPPSRPIHIRLAH